MSRGNLFLGTARGRIGSVVLYRIRGQEMARSYVSRVANPRTWGQAVSRVIAKTSYVAYSTLLPLCRQSWQGVDEGTPSQSAYHRRNYRLLRDRVAASIAAGRDAVLEDATANYNSMSDHIMLLNPLMVSDGGLSSLGVAVTENGLLLKSSTALAADASYQAVCNACGILAWDSIDVLMLQASPGGMVTRCEVCRIVMHPETGDMGTKFAMDGQVNSPNSGNSGLCSVTLGDGGVTFAWPGAIPNAGSVVRYHMSGSLRQVSPQWIVMPDDPASLLTHSFGAAVASGCEGDVYLDGL